MLATVAWPLLSSLSKTSEEERAHANAMGQAFEEVFDRVERNVPAGPLDEHRQEVVDDETSSAGLAFIEEKTAEGTPWFVWWSGTRMHFRTHVSEENRALADEIVGKHVDEYQAGMIEHDVDIGKFLDKLDELGIADNTIVFYSTDNGPHMNTWPDAGMTPFWGEKNTNWEGAWRVPAMVRWPGHIPEGEVTNQIVHHMDWLPTFLAAGRTGPSRPRTG